MTRRISKHAQAAQLGIHAGGYVPVQSSALPTTIVQTATPKITLTEAFKPKRAGKNAKLSHIVFVLDESSSMSSCWEQTIAGYNEYLEAQKQDAKATGIKTLVSLYKFNGHDVRSVFDRQDVETVNKLDKLTYRPSGSTNLLDAVGGVMIAINNSLASKKKKDRESVIISILTDGEENCSRAFVTSDIKGMKEKAEAKNWGFMFLGANIDAFAASSSLGFSYNNTLQFNTANAGETMRTAAAMTSRMKSAYANSLNTEAVYDTSAFLDVERKTAVGKND